MFDAIIKITYRLISCMKLIVTKSIINFAAFNCHYFLNKILNMFKFATFLNKLKCDLLDPYFFSNKLKINFFWNFNDWYKYYILVNPSMIITWHMNIWKFSLKIQFFWLLHLNIFWNKSLKKLLCVHPPQKTIYSLKLNITRHWFKVFKND